MNESGIDRMAANTFHIMSGHPQQGGYDDGYGQHHGNDAYYQDDHGYHDQYDYGHQQQGGEGYYDES